MLDKRAVWLEKIHETLHLTVDCPPPGQGLHASGNLAFVRDYEACQQLQRSARRGGAGPSTAAASWQAGAAYLVPRCPGLCDRALWTQVCSM